MLIVIVSLVLLIGCLFILQREKGNRNKSKILIAAGTNQSISLKVKETV